MPARDQSLAYLPDLLLPDEIRDGLDTRIFGKRDIVYFRETDSTNTRAKDLAARGAPEGTLVVCDKQKEGRGRKGRHWFSPSQEGIYASLILRPTISPGEALKITMLTAVAVAETLLSLTQLEVKIKWPNDILVNGKKIGGILTEISAERDAIDYVVVGLGLNVNTRRFPDDIREKATSILIETGKRFSRVGFMRGYLKRYEEYYENCKRTGFEPFRKRWREHTDIIGHQIIVEADGKKYVGEVLDINKDGALILKDSNGESHRILSGDVTVL